MERHLQSDGGNFAATTLRRQKLAPYVALEWPISART